MTQHRRTLTPARLVVYETLLALGAGLIIAVIRVGMEVQAVDPDAFRLLVIAVIGIMILMTVRCVRRAMASDDPDGTSDVEARGTNRVEPFTLRIWRIAAGVALVVVVMLVSMWVLLTVDSIPLLLDDSVAVKECVAVQDVVHRRMIAALRDTVITAEARTKAGTPTGTGVPFPSGVECRALSGGRVPLGTFAVVATDEPGETLRRLETQPVYETIARLLVTRPEARKEFEIWCHGRLGVPCSKGAVVAITEASAETVPELERQHPSWKILALEQGRGHRNFRLHAPWLYAFINTTPSVVRLRATYSVQEFDWGDLHWLRRPFLPWRRFEAVVPPSRVLVLQIRPSGMYSIEAEKAAGS